MQIIFFLILSTAVFSQKGGKPPECDPKEAERECYTRLCSSLPERVIPTDNAELLRNAEAHPYFLHPDVKKDSDKLVGVAKDVMKHASETVNNGGMSKIANDILSNPVQNFNVMEALFKGSFNCLKSNGNCLLISSDLDQYPPKMKELFKKWYEDTFLLREGMLLPATDLRPHLKKALSKFKNVLSKKEYKEEEKKIDRIRSFVDINDYMLSAGWFKNYREQIVTEMVPFAQDLEESLKIKIQDMGKSDPDQIQQKTFTSCQLASYLQTRLEQHATPAKFESERRKTLEHFRNKFLPKVSVESAAKLNQQLNDQTIQMLNLETNINPFSPNLRRHRDGYLKPEKSTDVIEDLILVDNASSHQCEVKTLLPIDVFHSGLETVFLSKYSVANSYSNVITHELGHWLSSQMKNKRMSKHSLKKLEKVRRCVKGFYPREKRPSQYANRHKGDHVFVEEDFADWFAAVAGAPGPGLYCDLGSIMTNFGNPHFETSYLPIHGDTHSGLLFRELTLRLNRNEVLPQSCRDLINVYPDSQPEKCEW